MMMHDGVSIDGPVYVCGKCAEARETWRNTSGHVVTVIRHWHENEHKLCGATTLMTEKKPERETLLIQGIRGSSDNTMRRQGRDETSDLRRSCVRGIED